MNEVWKDVTNKDVTNYDIRDRKKRKFLCTFGFKELTTICTGQFQPPALFSDYFRAMQLVG